jgi:predicted amidohydrolase
MTKYPESVVVAVTSMTTTSDRSANLRQAESLVRKAANAGADWIVLPEMFAWQGPYDVLFDQAEPWHGAVWEFLSGLAKELGVVLFGGSIAERPQTVHKNERKVYNVAYTFDRTGKEIGCYRKVHLFNLKSPDGKPLYCESDGYLAGDEAVIIDVDGFKVAMAICYDLRFHEFFAAVAQKSKFDAIVLPSAFTQRTGMDHWEVLVRARAIEHQAYFIAANQTGEHSPGKISYGHSMIVDPWGHKNCDTGDRIGMATATISHEVIRRYRAQLPALADRRQDVYQKIAESAVPVKEGFQL